MRVAILGSGAMGSLFGGILARSGQEVWLIDKWAEHIEALNKGLVIKDSEGRESLINVNASSDPEAVGGCDLVLIFVKSYDTFHALSGALPLLKSDTVLLTLQNGLGNVETIASLVGPDRVVAGVTAHGATLLGPGRIRHAGHGLTVIGEPGQSASTKARCIAGVFNRAGLETQVSDDALSLIWSKLMVNVGINALTALTGLRNGDLLLFQETRTLMEMAVKEAVSVAHARGITLASRDPVAHCFEVAKATGRNRSSMLQDVERGRRTEIDAINGAIAKEARSLGLRAPVNHVLTLLVKMREVKSLQDR